MNISHNKYPMKVIYSLLSTVLLSVAFSFSVFAQSDYLKKADSFITSGDYVNAEKQLKAQRTYLDSKKIDKNSNEYISVEKKLAKVTKCKNFMGEALRLLSGITTDAINEKFELAEDTLVVAGIAEDYIKKLKSARSNLREVSLTFTSDRNAKSKLSEVENLMSLVKAHSENFAETKDWKYAKSQNSKNVYESFLYKYPNGKWVALAREALSCLEEMDAWKQCLDVDNSTVYENYLAKYPKGNHREMADSLYKTRLDEETWAAADTKDKLIAYQKAFPLGLHISEASARLADIVETEVWSEVASDNTVLSFKDYLSKYPDGKYVDEAKNGLMRLEEKDVWMKAQNANTIEAYQEYLRTSKTRSYAADARDAIERLEKEQAVERDNVSWNSIKSSTDPNDFKRYLSTSSYRDPRNEKEASFKYNVLNASEFYRNKLYSEAAKYYEKAESIMPLSKEDSQKLVNAKQEHLYSVYYSDPSVENADNYLSLFPDGVYSNEIRSGVCRRIADEMTLSSSYEKEYRQALGYARTDDDRNYVNRRYRTIQNDTKKISRRLNRKSELFHLLLGVEGFYLFDIVEVPANEDIGQEASWTLASADCFGVAPMISFGGRSNRFNLEAGYDFINNQVIARPRLNLLKKSYSGSKLGHRRGSDYSLCALYVAPEAFIDVRNTDNIRYGIRGGFSLHWFDIFGGYKFNDNRLYFGLGVYFGNK